MLTYVVRKWIKWFLKYTEKSEQNMWLPFVWRNVTITGWCQYHPSNMYALLRNRRFGLIEKFPTRRARSNAFSIFRDILESKKIGLLRLPGRVSDPCDTRTAVAVRISFFFPRYILTGSSYRVLFRHRVKKNIANSFLRNRVFSRVSEQ